MAYLLMNYDEAELFFVPSIWHNLVMNINKYRDIIVKILAVFLLVFSIGFIELYRTTSAKTYTHKTNKLKLNLVDTLWGKGALQLEDVAPGLPKLREI